MSELKAVIFDLDDTLYPEIDYVKSGFKCVAQYLSSQTGMDTNNIFECFYHLFSENKYDVFNRFLSLNKIYDQILVKECVDTYRNHFPSIKMHPDVEGLLKWLKTREIKIGIITDGRPEGQWNKIRALGLEQYSNCIIVTDELGGPEFRKPSEIPYLKILDCLNVEPKEAVYIGDNPAKDFISAKKLGMNTIMLKKDKGIYSQTNTLPDFMAQSCIEDLTQLKGIIESW
jgi:putative hydrolase of the HAD superfamily